MKRVVDPPRVGWEDDNNGLAPSRSSLVVVIRQPEFRQNRVQYMGTTGIVPKGVPVDQIAEGGHCSLARSLLQSSRHPAGSTCSATGNADHQVAV
jgi:hypothetical protein